MADTDQMEDPRVVKFRLVDYYVEVTNPMDPDKKQLALRTASYGDTLDFAALHDADKLRLVEQGAFFTPEELAARSAEAGEEFAAAGVEASPSFGDGRETKSFAEMSTDEIREWIDTERPNISDTVAAAGGDPEIAEKILDAEEQGGDPRKGVVEGLNKILEIGGEDDEDDEDEE